jgi:cytidylate kinase
MVICISGSYRSGKSNFSKRLAALLHYEHYSMRKMFGKENMFNKNFINWRNVLKEKNGQKIDDFICEKAIKNKCILDFRFSSVICRKNNIPYIGVWINADFATRVRGNALLWEKSIHETEQIIKDREHFEKEYCKEHYKKDYTQKAFYNYFVDTTSYWFPIDIPMDTSPEVIKFIKYLGIV